MRTLVLALIGCMAAFAQGGGAGPITAVTTAPSGSCTSNAGQLVGPGGTIYTCQNGTWAQAGGSSSGAGGVFCAATITANAITCTPTTAVTSYTSGLVVNFTLNGNNTGATTIAVSGLAAKNVFLNGSAVSGSNFPSTTTLYSITYDGTEFNQSQPTVVANTFTGSQSAPAFLGTGVGAYANFTNNTSHSASAGDVWLNAGAWQENDGTNTGVFAKIVGNCSSSASPAVCGAASAGSFVVATSATSVVVDASTVTANSQIIVMVDTSLSTKLSVTCNADTTIANFLPIVTARTAGTSFTISITGPVAVNPACYSYLIIN